MRGRLAKDHENARRLAEGMAELPGLSVDVDAVETNILFVTVEGTTPAEFSAALEAEGVLTLSTGPDQCRFVTHADVDAEDVDRALAAMRSFLS
jgi:threonine aldolase